MRLHAAAGGGDSAPIFFSVDENIDRSTWNSVAVEWFRGINSVLGIDRTGIYGHSRACAWAIEDGVIGRSTTAGHRWAWQTAAWFYGEREPMAVQHQQIARPAVLLWLARCSPALAETRLAIATIGIATGLMSATSSQLARAGSRFFVSIRMRTLLRWSGPFIVAVVGTRGSCVA
jgi:hypothetical protein